MHQFDVYLFRALNGLAGKSPTFDAIVAWFAEYMLWVIVAVVIVVLLYKKRKDRQEFLPIFLLTSSSFLLSRVILTPIISLIISRLRPFLALPDVYLIPDLPYRLSASFPSGNAVSMFAIAFSFLPYNRKLAGILSLLAIFSALSRVVAGVHYPSDVLGAILLAYIVVWLVHRLAIRRFFRAQDEQLPVAQK